MTLHPWRLLIRLLYAKPSSTARHNAGYESLPFMQTFHAWNGWNVTFPRIGSSVTLAAACRCTQSRLWNRCMIGKTSSTAWSKRGNEQLPFPQTFHAWIGWNVTLPALESLHDREKYINKIKKHGMLQAGSIPFFLFGFMKKNRLSSLSAVHAADAVGEGRGEIQKNTVFQKNGWFFSKSML